MAPSLSLMALPGDGDLRGRKVAVLVADGVDGDGVAKVQSDLLGSGVVALFVGARLGTVTTASGGSIEVAATMENMPAVLFDGLVLPDGEVGVAALGADGQTSEFIQNQYRHCKTILAMGASSALIDKLGITATLPSGDPDPGLIVNVKGVGGAKAFLGALSRHRHYERDLEPPPV